MKVLPFPQPDERDPEPETSKPHGTNASGRDTAGPEAEDAHAGPAVSKVLAAPPKGPLLARLRARGRWIAGAGALLCIAAAAWAVSVRDTRRDLRREIERQRETVRALQSILAEDEASGWGRRLVDQTVPRGLLPGPILEDLRAALAESEITRFRYTLVPPFPLGGSGEEMEESTPDWDAPAFSSEGIAEATPWEQVDPALQATVDTRELLCWTIDLEVSDGFPQVVGFLQALHAQPRYWRVPRVVFGRQDEGLITQLSIATFLRPPSDGGVTVATTDGAPSLSPMGPHSILAEVTPTFDLFEPRSAAAPPAQRTAEPSASTETLPALEAVRFGLRPLARLNGRNLTIGDRIDGWTLIAIYPHGVSLEDRRGRTRILEVSDDARLP